MEPFAVLLAQSIWDGVLGGALRGAIIGAVIGGGLGIVLLIQKSLAKKKSTDADKEKEDKESTSP
jgi:hypothetical protein